LYTCLVSGLFMAWEVFYEFCFESSIWMFAKQMAGNYSKWTLWQYVGIETNTTLWTCQHIIDIGVFLVTLKFYDVLCSILS
jgi:hypothetical protein